MLTIIRFSKAERLKTESWERKTEKNELEKQRKIKNGDDDDDGHDEDHDHEIVVVSLRDNPQMVMQLGNCNSNGIRVF